AENAADVTSVRQALGYESWTLYGISYGTRYALATLRDQPGGTKSVILDSVVPPQVDLLADEGASIYASLHAVSAACQAQLDCYNTFGDVESKQLSILERLDGSPAELVASDGSSTEVSATLAASLFTTLLYSGAAIPYVPEIVQEIYEEDYSLFEQASSPGKDSVVDEATYLSVICAEEAPFSSAAALAEKSQTIPEPWRRWVTPERIFDACAIWDVPSAPALENDAVTNPIPTLVLSGGFDPVTPPAYGALAARTLPRSQFITLSDQAHASSISPCGKTLTHAFLQDPLGRVSAGCVSAPAAVFKGRGGFSALSATAEAPSAVRFVTTRERPPAETIKDAMFRASRLRPARIEVGATERHRGRR
ncbi:MAG TPA: alpha/beta hydrolase, partial [Polyangiaceae bacterium]